MIPGKATRIACLASAIWIVCLTTVTATAEIIYENFGEQVSAPSTGRLGISVTGPNSGISALDQAMPFTIDARPQVLEFRAQAVEIPIRLFPLSGETTPTFLLGIHGDIEGTPGTPIAQGLVTIGSVDPGIYLIELPDGPRLVNGETYWLVLSGFEKSSHLWLEPYPPIESAVRWRRAGSQFPWEGPFRWQAAFRIHGQVSQLVPVEPASWGAIKQMYANP